MLLEAYLTVSEVNQEHYWVTVGRTDLNIGTNRESFEVYFEYLTNLTVGDLKLVVVFVGVDHAVTLKESLPLTNDQSLLWAGLPIRVERLLQLIVEGDAADVGLMLWAQHLNAVAWNSALLWDAMRYGIDDDLIQTL